MTSMVRGSLKPDLTVTIADSRSDANFSGLTAADVNIMAELGGELMALGHPDTVTPSGDGKSMVVKRAWQAADTETAGRMWVSVVVSWPGTKPQTFPDDGPLRLDIVRAPGDA